MMSFVEDGSRPFDYVERLQDGPDGFEARIVRIAAGLPFDATVIMPLGAVPADTVDAEPVGDHAVLHHATPDLAAAEDWVLAWANR